MKRIIITSLLFVQAFGFLYAQDLSELKEIGTEVKNEVKTKSAAELEAEVAKSKVPDPIKSAANQEIDTKVSQPVKPVTQTVKPVSTAKPTTQSPSQTQSTTNAPTNNAPMKPVRIKSANSSSKSQTNANTSQTTTTPTTTSSSPTTTTSTTPKPVRVGTKKK